MSKYSIKHLPKSQIEVTLEIDQSDINSSYQKSLKKFVNRAEVKGFRKGKAPASLVESTVGKDKIYEDAINLAIPEQLEVSLNQEAKLKPDQRFIVLDYPQFNLTQEPKGLEPLIVSAICSLYPNIDLTNLIDKIKVNRQTTSDPTGEEIQSSIDKIFEQYKNIKSQHDKEQIVGKEKIIDANGDSVRVNKEVLMDDNFAKAAGSKDLEDLRLLVKEELKYEAQNKVERDFENDLIKKSSELVVVDMPDVLVKEELTRIEQRFKSQLDRLGMTFESYLSNENKTLEQIHLEWTSRAEENTKIALILNEWRIKNNLVITQEEIDRVAPKDKKISQQEYESIVYMLGQSKSLQHLKDHALKS